MCRLCGKVRSHSENRESCTHGRTARRARSFARDHAMTTIDPPPIEQDRGPSAADVDAEFELMTEALQAARTAIDDYLKTRSDFVVFNQAAYNDAAPTRSYGDADFAQNNIARMVDLIVLTFHPDRKVTATAWGLSLDAIEAQMSVENPALTESIARH